MGSANKASKQKYKSGLNLCQITNGTTQSAFAPELFYAVLGAFIGALMGFFLFAAWDAWKDSKLNKVERTRILSLLAIESVQNITSAKAIKELLLKERAKILTEGRLYTTSPPHLSSDGWTIAKSANPLKHMGKVDLRKWMLAYRNLVVVNDNLESRQMSKASSRGLGNYKELIKVYDSVISKAIDTYLKNVKEALDSLPDDIRASL